MFRRVAPVCVVAIALAACGGADSDAGDASPATAAEAPAESPAPAATQAPAGTQAPADASDGALAADVPEALQFSAPLIGGGEIEMGNLAGRPVLLWFWAPW